MKVVCLLLVLVAAVAADKIPDFVVSGKCPAVDTEGLWNQQRSEHARYAGVWYQQAITNNPYQPNKKCNRIEYSHDGQSFDAKTCGINAEVFAAPYTLLDTDYSNYACIYSCIDYNYGYYSDFAFIFTRSATPSDNYIKKCLDVFQSYNVDSSRFERTEQGSSCPYDALKAL
ncbi:hypothetical protein Pcinc_037004 [Petrolisthes cinctipes]|uniref:Lipocalin/cytosolic fatty-acid binding domain-containing protein n=1 Tax=Petrolisthes cinctipes TaxID=88211 RepID=A0AAE1ELE4_PETCI|nr:hypothetical protein Pcinc_037004 [Petrolisthes cinctipes]